jgi:hypothetical protein
MATLEVVLNHKIYFLQESNLFHVDTICKPSYSFLRVINDNLPFRSFEICLFSPSSAA